MNLDLRLLNQNDREAFIEGLSLFSDMDPDWYSFVWTEGMLFHEMLEILENRARGVNLKAGFVPDSMLYAFLDGKIVGRVSIRHELNDFLFSEGGHVGYAVATKYRKMGIASEILKQSKIYCRDVLKLSKILVTCDDENIGSYKVIERNGGVLESKNISNDGTKIKRRYWINL